MNDEISIDLTRDPSFDNIDWGDFGDTGGRTYPQTYSDPNGRVYSDEELNAILNNQDPVTGQPIVSSGWTTSGDLDPTAPFVSNTGDNAFDKILNWASKAAPALLSNPNFWNYLASQQIKNSAKQGSYTPPTPGHSSSSSTQTVVLPYRDTSTLMSKPTKYADGGAVDAGYKPGIEPMKRTYVGMSPEEMKDYGYKGGVHQFFNKVNPLVDIQGGIFNTTENTPSLQVGLGGGISAIKTPTGGFQSFKIGDQNISLAEAQKWAQQQAMSGPTGLESIGKFLTSNGITDPAKQQQVLNALFENQQYGSNLLSQDPSGNWKANPITYSRYMLTRGPNAIGTLGTTGAGLSAFSNLPSGDKTFWRDAISRANAAGATTPQQIAEVIGQPVDAVEIGMGWAKSGDTDVSQFSDDQIRGYLDQMNRQYSGQDLVKRIAADAQKNQFSYGDLANMMGRVGLTQFSDPNKLAQMAVEAGTPLSGPAIQSPVSSAPQQAPAYNQFSQDQRVQGITDLARSGDFGAINQAVSQYGYTPEQAARDFGVSVADVQNYAQQHGIQFKSGGLTALGGGYAKGGQSRGLLVGPGGGQDDLIPAQMDDGKPARLGDGEYVMDAETVSALGDGSTRAGAQKLDELRKQLRSHKRSAPPNKIPPKAKPIGAYMKKGK